MREGRREGGREGGREEVREGGMEMCENTCICTCTYIHWKFMHDVLTVRYVHTCISAHMPNLSYKSIT